MPNWLYNGMSKRSTKSQQNWCQCLSITNDPFSVRPEKFPFLPGFRRDTNSPRAGLWLGCAAAGVTFGDWSRRVTKAGSDKVTKVSSRMGIPLPMLRLNKASIRGLDWVTLANTPWVMPYKYPATGRKLETKCNQSRNKAHFLSDELPQHGNSEWLIRKSETSRKKKNTTCQMWDKLSTNTKRRQACKILC